MVGSLLREGYGVGALVTAGVIKGFSITADFINRLTNRHSSLRSSSVKQYGKWRQKKSSLTDSSFLTDNGQNAVADALTTSVTWSKADTPDPEGEEPSDSSALEDHFNEVEEPSEDTEFADFIQDAFSDNPEFLDDPEFGNKMELEESLSVESVLEEETREAEEPPSPMSSEEEEEEESLSLSSDIGESSRDTNTNNSFQTLSNNREESDNTIDNDSSTTSFTYNRAMELLDEIASFQMESGDAFMMDDDDEEEEESSKQSSVPSNVQQPKAEDDKERAEKDSRKQSRSMKKQKKSPRKRVNVVKPSKDEIWKNWKPSGTDPRRKGGLDYIKSFTKDNRGNVGDNTENDSIISESNSAFVKPPSFLQDNSRVQSMGSSATGSYSRWTEVDRLKKVREIGTVLWVGKGGGNGGNNGGSGGGGGGGGGRDGYSNDGSGDRDWWIQVGISMFIMTILSFTLLTTIANHVEKRNSRLKKHS
eukprot:g2164.t1